jgi:hypothetical protein
MSIAFEPFDVEAFRKRLAKFTDAELIEYGKSARYMCTPEAHLGKPPRDIDWTQLRECKGEWLRRHPRGE